MTEMHPAYDAQASVFQRTYTDTDTKTNKQKEQEKQMLKQ